MTLITGQAGSAGVNPPLDYRSMPTDELLHRIAFCGNRAALNEFHDHRRLFRIKDGPPLLFAEFVQAILRAERRMGFFGMSASELDRAYDLTVDKFLQLPVDHAALAAPPSGRRVRSGKRGGTDCRRYFMAIDRAIRAWQRRHPQAVPLALEAATVQIAQRRVAYHCWWSCLEAKRGLRAAWSRFRWQLPKGPIIVWMPRWMPGHQRRAWLEAHVISPDPVRSGERQRIQGIIGGAFGTVEPVSFDELAHTSRTTGSVIDLLIEHEVAERGLATFVVREKTMRIKEQRDSIRALGKKGLKRLLKRIFEDLPGGCLEDREQAAAFGLSPPTYSRFAGSEWEPQDDRAVPDLWLNVARIVWCFPAFREVAKAARVWDRIETIVEADINRGLTHA